MQPFPKPAAAPFYPSEAREILDAVGARPWWRRLLRVSGPGLLVAVGYMDPGNWATDIEAGSRYGMALKSAYTGAAVNRRNRCRSGGMARVFSRSIPSTQ